MIIFVMSHFCQLFFKLLITLAIILFGGQVKATPARNVVLVYSNNHLELVHHIEAALFTQPAPRPRLTNVVANTIHQNDYFDTLNDLSLIVTIGSEALKNVLQTQTKLPILSILCRKNTFHTLLKFSRKSSKKAPAVSAIYLDQPIKRQFYLLTTLLENHPHPNIGTLLGAQSLEEQETLQALANEHHMLLNVAYVRPNENPAAALDTLLNETDLLLAIPDTDIYNPATLQGIFLTTFYQRVPLVGYSKAYVKNGALAAIYSTMKQIAKQTVGEILQYTQEDGTRLSFIQYPEEFTVAVNYQVAHTLQLSVGTEASLKQRIEQIEQMENKKLSHDTKL